MRHDTRDTTGTVVNNGLNVQQIQQVFFTTIVEDETVVYEVQIKTGDLDNAETPKQVTLQLIGKYGRTSKKF